MPKLRALLLVTVAGACVLSAGCLFLAAAGGAAAGAGAAIYYSGRLEKTVSAPLADTYEAALAALEREELPVVERRRDALTGRITSRYADDKQVWIDLEAVDGGFTRVRIRVGVIGDEQRATRLMSAIEAGL